MAYSKFWHKWLSEGRKLGDFEPKIKSNNNNVVAPEEKPLSAEL